jgi:hypothetical protein
MPLLKMQRISKEDQTSPEAPDTQLGPSHQV